MIAAAADPCRRCGTPLELADLRCCICALPAPAQASGARDERPVARVLRCQECAAAIAYAAEHQAPSCAFCGSVMEVEEPVDPVEEAELLLPFTVERDAARAALRRWLRSLGWFRPSDLSSSATIESLRPLHWAAWIFDADADVTWAADSDAGAGRSRWAPHAGSARFTWRDILVSASRGLTSRETSRLAGGYRLDSAVRIGEAGRAAGAGAIEDDAIEAFDTQRSAARRLIVSTVEGIAERQLIEGGHIPGGRFRNVHASVLISRLKTRRVVLPSWVLAYRYKGALFRSIVHGQDQSIAFGEAPISWAKVLPVAGLGLGVLLAILFLLLN